MPRVRLTEEHAKLSLVRVGDTLPDFKLPDEQGAQRSLSELQGKHLTVVCFWSHRQLYAVEELFDLGPMIVKPLGKRGVNVVAVHERGTPETISGKVDITKLEFPMLFDADGTMLAKIATARLPRTYLVDSERKVLWFDLEYSRTTRRDLLAAIEVSLKHAAAAPSSKATAPPSKETAPASKAPTSKPPASKAP